MNTKVNSWLTIRQEDDTDDWSAPIMWLDDMSEYDLFPSDDLNIDWVEDCLLYTSPSPRDSV